MGEKTNPLPDSIPEESASADRDEKKPTTPLNEGRLSWLALDVTKSEWEVLIASTCLKLLLFPA